MYRSSIIVTVMYFKCSHFHNFIFTQSQFLSLVFQSRDDVSSNSQESRKNFINLPKINPHKLIPETCQTNHFYHFFKFHSDKKTKMSKIRTYEVHNFVMFYLAMNERTTERRQKRFPLITWNK